MLHLFPNSPDTRGKGLRSYCKADKSRTRRSSPPVNVLVINVHAAGYAPTDEPPDSRGTDNGPTRHGVHGRYGTGRHARHRERPAPSFPVSHAALTLQGREQGCLAVTNRHQIVFYGCCRRIRYVQQTLRFRIRGDPSACAVASSNRFVPIRCFLSSINIFSKPSCSQPLYNSGSTSRPSPIHSHPHN